MADGYGSTTASVLERLSIIAQAEQLGCTVEEIAEILAADEAGRCAPVQNRLSEMLAGRWSTPGRASSS